MKIEPIVLASDVEDPEDFDVSALGLDRGQKARLIHTARVGLGLSQAEFAQRYRVPIQTLLDWEQARTAAPDFAVAYVRVIARHPEMVASIVA